MTRLTLQNKLEPQELRAPQYTRLVLATVVRVATLIGLVLPSCSRAPASDTAFETSDNPAKVVKEYLNLPNCDDRVKYVVNPDGDRAAMKDYYKDRASCAVPYQSIEEKTCDKLDADGRCTMKVIWGENKTAFGTRVSSSWVCLQKMPTGIKVDWRCTTGYGGLTLKALKARHAGRRPGESLDGRFRLYAKMGDYFNFEYLNAAKTHYSVDLNDEDGERIHGYVRKDSATGAALFDKLKDGEVHAVVMNLSYSRRSEDSDEANIDDFVTGWWERPEDFPAPPQPSPSSNGAATASPSASAAPPAATDTAPALRAAPIPAAPPVITPAPPTPTPPTPTVRPPVAPPVNPYVTRIQQCCAAMHAGLSQFTAKDLKKMTAAAAQCDVVAGQAAAGTTPDVASVRRLVHSRPMPPACTGLF